MTKYDYPLDLTEGSVCQMLLKNISPHSTVLEFGCAAGRMTRFMKEELFCDVYIVELDPDQFQKALEYAKDGCCDNAETLSWFQRFKAIRFDYILFADILEHLVSPGIVLAKTEELLNSDGKVLISIPNIAHADILFRLYQSTFHYTELGLLDNTHLRFWAKNDIDEFCIKAGYGIVEQDAFYLKAFGTEQNPDRSSLPQALIRIVTCQPFAEIYEFILVLQKKEWIQANNISCVSHLPSADAAVLKDCFFYDEIEEKYGQLQEKLADVQQKFVDMNIAYRQNLAAYANKETELAAAREQYMRLETACLEKEVTLTDTLTLLKSIQEQESQLEESCRNSQLVIASKDAKLATELEQLARMETAFKESQSMYEKTQEKLASLQKHADWLHVQYHLMLHSHSWRMTEPLRVGVYKLKNYKTLIQKGNKSLRQVGIKQTFRKIRRYRRGITQKHPAKQPERKQRMQFTSFAELKKALDGDKEIRLYACDTIAGYDQCHKKKVLLVSHELNRTGAPVAVFNYARFLKMQDYLPVLMGPKEDTLCNECKTENLPLIVNYQLFSPQKVEEMVSLFDVVVVSTIVGAPVVQGIMHKGVPIIWWIHEAAISYYPQAIQQLPMQLPPNVHVYCGGARPQKQLLSIRPSYKARQLLYYTPDYAYETPVSSQDLPLEIPDNKLVFACVGSHEQRKGQDILCGAIKRLKPSELDRCLFVFVGKDYYQPADQAIAGLCTDIPDHVVSFQQLDRKALNALMQRIDCYLCVSRDDPMPIVVTEAMVFSKPIVCSENAGQASLFNSHLQPLIYRQDDPAELLAQIRKFVRGTVDVKAAGRESRELYEHYFAKETFQKNIQRIMESFDTPPDEEGTINADISIIIPTYNAAKELPALVDKLLSQKAIREPEILVIDSGSTDETIAICKSKNVRLIEIPHESFSHSYARNLGVESASGDIVLLMTQDAWPASDYWIANLTRPIFLGEAIAVSCKEFCTQSADLYYKVSSFLHSRFMQTDNGDVFGSIENADNPQALRRNANLNDIACAVDRATLLHYKYRFTFGEDLDLGLRLIQDGYRLKFLSSEQVIHGHHRTAGYYLKRSIVDTETVAKIMGDPICYAADDVIATYVLAIYNAVVHMVIQTKKECKGYCSLEQFHTILMAQYVRVKNDPAILLGTPKKVEQIDQEYQSLVLQIYQYANMDKRTVKQAPENLIAFWEKCIMAYLLEVGNTQMLSVEQQCEIFDTLIKRAAAETGMLLSRCKDGSALHSLTIHLRKDV